MDEAGGLFAAIGSQRGGHQLDVCREMIPLLIDLSVPGRAPLSWVR